MVYQIGGAPVDFVLGCDQGPSVDGNVRGRLNQPEWLRTAFHDMATADVAAGTGGLDASIAFELDRPENKGRAIPDALSFFREFQSPHVSLSDLIALSALQSVQVCSNPPVVVPFRAGRLDATEAGPPGVPEPHQKLTEHTAMFKKAGFNETEMIALVACGHSMGGVHGSDFPEIVPTINDPVRCVP